MPRIVGYLDVHERLSSEEHAENSGALRFDHRTHTDTGAYDDKFKALARKNEELEGKLHSKEHEVEQVFICSQLPNCLSSIIRSQRLMLDEPGKTRLLKLHRKEGDPLTKSNRASCSSQRQGKFSIIGFR
jgi:hypothetical protein